MGVYRSSSTIVICRLIKETEKAQIKETRWVYTDSHRRCDDNVRIFFKAIKKTFGVKSVQIITHGYVDICNDYDQDPETTKKSIYQKIQGYH